MLLVGSAKPKPAWLLCNVLSDPLWEQSTMNWLSHPSLQYPVPRCGDLLGPPSLGPWEQPHTSSQRHNKLKGQENPLIITQRK